jgi:hypothetical protein
MKAMLTSQLINIKKCAVLFKLVVDGVLVVTFDKKYSKLAGKCTKMKMACSNFNVPKGPDRWFSLDPPGKR